MSRPAEVESFLTPAPGAKTIRHAEIAGPMIDGLEPSEELRSVLEVRVPDLIAYQNTRYAEAYLDTVRTALAAERSVLDHDGDFGLEVAKGLHKVMAYKDEYEVARLLLEAEAEAQLQAEFGEGIKVQWNLNPPMMRSFGVDRKLRLGAWFRPVLVGLRAAKRLRGTRVDVFGRAQVRRVERSLVRHYSQMVQETCSRMTTDSFDDCVAIVRLAEVVRGYEHVKLGNVAQYLESADELCTKLGFSVDRDEHLRSVA